MLKQGLTGKTACAVWIAAALALGGVLITQNGIWVIQKIVDISRKHSIKKFGIGIAELFERSGVSPENLYEWGKDIITAYRNRSADGSIFFEPGHLRENPDWIVSAFKTTNIIIAVRDEWNPAVIIFVQSWECGDVHIEVREHEKREGPAKEGYAWSKHITIYNPHR